MPHSCSYEGLWSCKGSAILPAASHQGVSLLAQWCNWQIGRCHLTPGFQCILFPSLVSENGVLRVREFFLSSGTVWHKKLVYTELHISGSGSAYVGDRGICGLKPLYLPLHKSCFIAYTLANMICIVTSLPAS